MARIGVYHFNGRGERECIKYDNVVSISAGSAAYILGAADAAGNGLQADAPLIQIELSGGETATFDADGIYIALY